MKTNSNALTPELLHKKDAYWRAANYPAGFGHGGLKEIK